MGSPVGVPEVDAEADDDADADDELAAEDEAVDPPEDPQAARVNARGAARATKVIERVRIRPPQGEVTI